MARYPYARRHGRRGRIRRRIYIVSLLVVVVVLIFVYRPFGKNKDETAETSINTDAEQEQVADNKIPAVIVQPKPEPRPEPNLPEIAPESIAEPDSETAELIAEAMACINAKPAGIIEARGILNEVLPMLSGQQRAFVKEQLSKLADKWLFSRTVYAQDELCGNYEVEPGDQLRTISKRYNVPWEILSQINKIRPEALQAGKTIKVTKGPFHAKIYRSTFTMDLYLQNTFVRSFTVGLGKPSMETPTGLWLVEPGGRMIKPRWRDPITGKTYEPNDPNYPLGSRWIGLEGIEGDAKGRDGFAIHGTKEPEQIGTAGSQGCIRMHNGDAILVYNLLMPSLSRVKVLE